MSKDRIATPSVLEAVRSLAPEIAARGDEIEQTRAVPADLLEKLTAAGVFRMLLPREFGGEQLDLPEACRVLREIAQADGSAGWTSMIGADFAIVWGRFPRDVLEEVFANGPDVMVRGAFAPKGIAVAGTDGFVVSGQWPLASGSYDYQWVMGNCVVLEDGAPRIGPDGIPDTRVALVPADQASFLDTWHSMGLAGTASNDFVISDQFVTERHAASFFGGSVVDAPLYRMPLRVALVPTHSAVCLGIAEGLVQDLGQLATTKRPAVNPRQRLAEDPVFQWRLGSPRASTPRGPSFDGQSVRRHSPYIRIPAKTRRPISWSKRTDTERRPGELPLGVSRQLPWPSAGCRRPPSPRARPPLRPARPPPASSRPPRMPSSARSW
jgi:hypothetical protein